MYLRKIPALSSQLLPDIRNRVNPDDIHSLIGKIQEIIHHLIKYPGICVIQIPLVGIETGHNMVPDLRQPRKIPRRCSRKYLRHRRLELSRNIKAVIEEIPAHILAVPLSCLHCPLMILGSMVHYKIHAQVHSLVMAFLCKLRQILHCSKIRPYLPEISYRIAPVGPALRCIQKRHQMNTVHITVLQIRKLLPYSLQIPCKVIYVQHHAQHILLPKPLRILLPPLIQTL